MVGVLTMREYNVPFSYYKTFIRGLASKERNLTYETVGENKLYPQLAR